MQFPCSRIETVRWAIPLRILVRYTIMIARVQALSDGRHPDGRDEFKAVGR